LLCATFILVIANLNDGISGLRQLKGNVRLASKGPYLSSAVGAPISNALLLSSDAQTAVDLQDAPGRVVVLENI
jgi:hypothetical protein